MAGAKFVLLGIGALISLFYFIFHSEKIINRSLVLNIVYILFIFFIPLYGFLVYSIRGGDGEFIDKSYVSSPVYLMATHFALYKINVEKLINAAVCSIRILSFSVIIFSFLYALNTGESVLLFFLENGVVYLGERNYFGIDFLYIYFVASPLLIILYLHDIINFAESKTKIKFLTLLVTGASLFLTGTRASIILSFVLPLLFLFFYSKFYLKLLTGAALIIVFFYFYNEVIGVLIAFFDSNESSNSMKFSYIKNYIDIFSNPIDILFGQGFNAHVWSFDFREMLVDNVDGASKTELTYLELIRVFGIFVALFVFCIILLMLYLLRRDLKNKWLYVGSGVYFISASVNPYLFSANGFMLIGLIIISLFGWQGGHGGKPLREAPCL